MEHRRFLQTAYTARTARKGRQHYQATEVQVRHKSKHNREVGGAPGEEEGNEDGC